MALTKQYVDLIKDKMGLKLSPTKSLATTEKAPVEYLRKMALPHYYYYPDWDGLKPNRGRRLYPMVVPFAHNMGNDDFQETLKGLPPAIQALGRYARFHNTDQHPLIYEIVMNVYIPKCPFGGGTKPTKYMPNYLRAEYEALNGAHPDDDEFDDSSDKSRFMVTITSPSMLLDVASKEAAFLNMKIDDALGRQFQKEITNKTFSEGLENQRLWRLLNAITAGDQSMIDRIRRQVEPVPDFFK